MSSEQSKTLFDDLTSQRPGGTAKALGPDFEKSYERNYPVAKHGDPLTSFMARESEINSGRIRGQCKAVLAALRKNPGCTSMELAVFMNWERHLVAKVLPDLKKRGLAEQGMIRLCKIGHRRCVTWKAV